MTVEQSPNPSERFHRVLAFASDEADGLGHGFVTCQHLLYALSRENRGIAGAVLHDLGITPQKLHTLLEEMSAEHDRLEDGQLDLADESRHAIERAVIAAHEWGHRLLDTEHLLYGLISVSTSADELLLSLQVRPKSVLNHLRKLQQIAPEDAVRDEAAHAFRFTLESAWLLSMAMNTARRVGATKVTGLHLLIALLSQDNPFQEVLSTQYNIDAEHVLKRISQSAHTRGRLPLDQDVQRILGYSIGEAWNRGHQAVTPLHIGMGMARADRHPALDILADLGLSQSELIDLLEDAMPPAVSR